MNRTRYLIPAICAIASCLCAQSPTEDIKLLTATGHPMQYYVSLPKGWTATKKWPTVMIFEAAEKEYKANLNRFVDARGELPFIFVAPIHTNNGNQGRRDPNLFPYSIETWNYIDKVGDCIFNDDGIKQIFIDCKAKFSAEEQYYITGFEAGTHLLWSMIFHRPEFVKAAAPVAGNFRARCVDVNSISSNPVKSKIPINAFVGELDDAWGPSAMLYGQWVEAKNLALKNGYKEITETIIKGKGHEPMPSEVLAYFIKLSK
jgi:poly(3-hydroxybutyrate) depolymerase